MYALIVTIIVEAEVLEEVEANKAHVLFRGVALHTVCIYFHPTSIPQDRMSIFPMQGVCVFGGYSTPMVIELDFGSKSKAHLIMFHVMTIKR